ncbi:466_t:CDS:2 [Paraglomus brasilianum]|uniref:466_t:CDS:1 n=1 Tax=Paraglomus brasilianum TaxID=144538 RepID=A0A9N9GJR0_9GLOM|nr:466_t:CDS:2 [Paraglomus brasilianum]
MANLPPEIWKEIVDSFSDNHSLRSLLLVNKSFSSLAVRKLYVRVVIGSSAQFNKFADTIAALNNKGYYDYTTFVRAITINTFKREASFPWFRLPSIFALCENVDGLLIGPTEQYADRQTVSVLEDMPSVTLVTRCLAIIIEMLASRSIRRLCLRSLRFLAEFQRNGVHFSAALGKLRDLQSLELWHESGRPLGDGGKKCIVQLVQMNDLKELHLDTFVTDELELDNALTIFENSPNLESLTWWGTHFNKDDEDYLYRTIFKECTKLHKLIVEVSGFQEGDDFLRLSRHSQGLEELTTWCDIGIGALPLSTFMTFIIRNASTLKHVNALISLAGPPVNRRVRNNNSNRNTFERDRSLRFSKRRTENGILIMTLLSLYLILDFHLC